MKAKARAEAGSSSRIVAGTPKSSASGSNAAKSQPKAENLTTMREKLASIDLEDVEEVPPSVEDVSDGIDVDFDDGSSGSVDKLLEMTGENWSIDAQRETLRGPRRTRTTGPRASG